MKKRIPAFFLLSVVLLSAFSVCVPMTADAVSFQSLGNINSCTVDVSRDVILIQGSVKHSVLISNRGAQIAVYRFDPWVDVSVAIADAKPLETKDISISFEFELPCTTVVQKTSLYAVSLIKPDGNVSLMTAPLYPDATSGDTSEAGFKSVLTGDAASALASLPGSAVVDVYLDKLNNGNNSGYIFNADGSLYYFDKAEINNLDRTVRSYTAANANVFLRFLISPQITNLPFCADSATWATNKCIIVDNADAQKALYAYTYFLVSRYSEGSYGNVKGIILGRGADSPVLYNSAILVSDDYSTAYARSLALIGLAASEARSGSEISLLVPIGDLLTSHGRVNGEEFLFSVADYLKSYSNMTFTVLCESRHNPYGITDEMFSSELEPEETVSDTTSEEIASPESSPETLSPPETLESGTVTTEGEEDLTDPLVTDVVIPGVPEDTFTPETTSSVSEAETTQIITDIAENESEVSVYAEESTAEPNKLQPNKNSDGYFCTDNLDVFIKMFEKLKKSYSSVNKGWCWCWYPDINTSESALGVCYAYNYMRLAAAGADMYAVGFENDLSEKFSSIAHLFKYIDTSQNIKETAYTRSVFGVSDWSELVDNFKPGTGVHSSLLENELQSNIGDFSGNVVYFDYTSNNGVIDWYEGLHCKSISLQNSEGTGFLQIDMDLESAGFAQAEIGYILTEREPLLVGDALTFDVECGENDSSIYELSVYISYEGGTLISKAVIMGGVKSALSVNVSKFDSTTLVNSVRISLKRVTGEGPCTLKLYKVTINDYFDNDSLLEQKFEDVRDYLRSEAEAESDANRIGIIIGVLSLTGVGAVMLIWAYSSDRRKGNSGKNIL